MVRQRALPLGRPRLPEMRQPVEASPVTGRTAYACGNCGNQVYPLAGTIFAKSKGCRNSLDVWIAAKTFLEAKIEGQPRRLDGVYHPVEVSFAITGR